MRLIYDENTGLEVGIERATIDHNGQAQIESLLFPSWVWQKGGILPNISQKFVYLDLLAPQSPIL